MSGPGGLMSRRTFLAGNAALLAGFGLARARTASAAPPALPDLALFRPVTVSSTAYAPTPAAFAVDGLADTGVRGSGWRALTSDPQWITVDLQAPCEIHGVTLVFEATPSDPVFQPASGSNPFQNTLGTEILSSYPTAFTLDVSPDGRTWTTAYRTTSGTGGTTEIALPAPVSARWVRLSATQQANSSPLGLNGFAVFGTTSHERPQVTGWTSWPLNERAAPALQVAADGTVALESGWDLTLDEWAPSSGGAGISRPGVDTSHWLAATVPGTVLASLVEQDVLPDPVRGFNNLEIPEALSRHSWWYRRTFAVPRGLPRGTGRWVWLELDGINHAADVWLNGTKVGSVTYPFARAALDVTRALTGAAEQVLAVEISPMPHPGTPGDKGPDGASFKNSSEVELDDPTYLSVSGWDWMPAVRDRVSGIWDHVRLRSTGQAVLGDPRVDTALPNLPATDVAQLTIAVPVRNAGSSAVQTTVTAAFGDVQVSRTVMLSGGASTEIIFEPADFPQLTVDDPALWWPNGYGEPTLHALTMTATVGGQLSDRRARSFGIRQFAYTSKLPVVIGEDDHGTQTESFAPQTAKFLRLQFGTRATGFGDSIWTLSVFDSANPGTDLALHQTATSSSVDDPSRPASNAVDGDDTTRWSSGYEDDQWLQIEFGSAATFDQILIDWEDAYALTYTIQVSDDGQTFTDVLAVDNSPVPLQISVNGVRVLCRGGNWGFDELLRRMLPTRMDNVVAMHRDMNFTMIRNWTGNSNREEFFAACDANGILVWTEFAMADGLGPSTGSFDSFLSVAADTILRYRIHPCIAVWCGANESLPPAPIDTGLRDSVSQQDPGTLYQSISNTGIVSGSGPYSWTDPVNYYSASLYSGDTFGFHTEIGIPTVSVLESMQHLIGLALDPSDETPISISSADQGTQTESFAAQRARYVRILGGQRVTGFGDSIWTLSVLDSGRPGTDLALHRPASSSSVDDPSRPASNAVDGDDSTRWASADEDGQWIQVDLGSRQTFDQVKITWERAYPLDYRIQVSDDASEWRTVKYVDTGSAWFLHDWCTNGNQAPQGYQAAIEARLGNVDTLAAFCQKAQFVNYESMRAIFEAFNANLWNTASAVLLWMSNPAHHSTVWQTYDYDLDVNGSYFGARKGCEPLHVQASLDTWQVLVVNHTAAPRSGLGVSAQLVDLSGRSLAAPQTATVGVGMSATAPAFTVPFGSALPSPHLLRLTLTDASGTVLSRNDYLRYTTDTDVQAVTALPPVALAASRGSVAGRSVQLRNEGSHVAALVSFSLRDGRTGERVLPARYSDSFLWLAPGERREIDVSFNGRVQSPSLMIEGLNVPRQTVAL
jgi:hypothetical protein